MRQPLLAALALGLGLLAAGCSPKLDGAPCQSDDVCPTQQHCQAGQCVDGARTATGATGTSAASGSSGTSGSSTTGTIGGTTGSASTGSTGSTASSTSTSGSSGSSGSTGTVCPDQPPVAGNLCTTPGQMNCDGAQVVTCTSDDGGCGSWTPTADCSSANLACGTDGGSAGCLCPAPGSQAGAGCGAPGDLGCDGNELVECDFDSFGCPVWFQGADCTADQLECQATGTTATCGCPLYDPTQGIYVNPRSSSTWVPTPTGAPMPADCAFKRIADGVAAASALSGPTTVILEGNSMPAAWLPNHAYPAGAMVTPRNLNGFAYVTVAGGTSLDTEPTWQVSSGAPTAEKYPDGGVAIQWDQAGTAQELPFPNEPSSLALPPDLTLTTTECLDLDSGSCEARAFVYEVHGNPDSGAVLRLRRGDTLAGLTIRNTDPVAANDLVRCVADGGVDIDVVHLLGGWSAGGNIAHGLALGGHCAANVYDVVATGFTQSSVDVRLLDSTPVSFDHLNASGTPAEPNDAGAYIESGLVSISNSDFTGNRWAGLLTQGTTALDLTVATTRARANGFWGLQLGGNFSSRFTLTTLDVARNGPGCGSVNSCGGLAIVAKGAQLGQMTGVKIHDNGGAQVYFGPGANPGYPDGGTAAEWVLGDPFNTGLATKIYCYTSSKLPAGAPNAIGIEDQNLALTTQWGVNGNYVMWDVAQPSYPTDYSPAGLVTANTTWGAANATCTGP